MGFGVRGKGLGVRDCEGGGRVRFRCRGVSGSDFTLLGLGFRVWGLGLMAWGLGFRVRCLLIRVSGFGFE